MFRLEGLDIKLQMKQYLKEKSIKNMLGGNIKWFNERTFWLINYYSARRNNFQMPNEGNVIDKKRKWSHFSSA